MKRVELLLLVLSLMVGACETRSHLNPLDPDNPDTGGIPGNLSALAGDEEVELVFEMMEIEDVAGFRVWRWEPGGETLGVGGGIVPTVEGSLTDTTVANGVTYGYLAEVLVGEDGESHRGSPVFATPGPNRLWAIDGAFPPLARLTADGRVLRSRTGAGGPYSHIQVNQSDGTIWVADEWNGSIIHYDVDGEFLLEIEDRTAPSHLAIDESGHALWVLSRRERTLVEMNEVGMTLDSTSIGGFGTLWDLEIDPFDTSVWVAAGGDGLLHIVPGTPPAAFAGSGSVVYNVAADPGGKGLWATEPSHGQVDFFRRSSSFLNWPQFAFGGLYEPLEVVAPASAGDAALAWVADDAGALVLLEALSDGLSDEIVIRERLRVTGVSSPRGLVTDAAGGCWFFNGATGRLMHVDAAGSKLTELAQLSSPRGLAAWWRE